MKIFLDTSVLIAAVIQRHEHHARAFGILDRVQNEKDEGHIAAHSLAEMYSVLTKAPVPFRHTPEQALLSIEENVLKYFKTTALSATDYSNLIREAALSGVQGGTVFDALLLRCAAKSEAQKIFTLNLRHFQNIAPASFGAQIVGP